MIAVSGNPNCWWNVNGIRSPPPLLVAPAAAPPTSFGSTAPSNLFPAASAASCSSSSSSSWQDINNSELPVSWSQLLLGGGLVGEDHKSGNNMSHFQDQQSRNGSSAIDHVKQENSASSYNSIYGHANTHQQDFSLASAAKPSAWSPMAPVSSFANSCTTSIETNNVLDYSKNDRSARNPAKDRVYECNSIANGGAQKKARVQPSSAQSTFKVRKEKLGDRITALHQIVSPFGKTDTASVLLEAIGYIRFLHGQIEALSLPYLGKDSGNLRHPGQGERNYIFPEDPGQNYEEEIEQMKDLRSKGLCLIPISCTLEVGNENNIGADYWAAASFGGGVNLHY
ncbi:hypothetical protein CDL15_Pgr015474 [Punica granatum]|nr:hypothetical protein CDL15_Pgr015474 [Punica granatum]